MNTYVRFGYARATSTGSMSVHRDQMRVTTIRLQSDPEVITAYYYPHPASAAVWIKGDAETHRRITERINTLSR